MEAEGFDALADERDRRLEAAVDEDEAVGCDDEIGGQVFAADVIEVAGDAEGGKGFGPAGIGGRGSEVEGGGEDQEEGKGLEEG
jgi:hypothetical protein